MKKRLIILYLLFISWPINNIHRLWNRHPYDLRHFYPFNPLREEDLQWYIKDICSCISLILVFTSIWIYVSSRMKKDRGIINMIGIRLFIAVIDLFHYILWHRSSEFVLTIEGTVYFIAAVINFKNDNSKV